MVALGSNEYRWPGNSTAESGTLASVSCSERYIAAGSLPGRSIRPQPSRNSVSPATSAPPTRKHWLPGVCPGVCSNSMSMAPTDTTSPGACSSMSLIEMPVVLRTSSASGACRWIFVPWRSSSWATPSML